MFKVYLIRWKFFWLKTNTKMKRDVLSLCCINNEHSIDIWNWDEIFLLMFVGLCWNSHVGHLEACQQHYAAVCGLLLSERHYHSLRPGVRLTPEFILLHFPGAIAICSLSLPWCQIMHCVWIFCEATVGDELLLKIIWMHLRKQVCLLNFRADFFYLNMMYSYM